MLCSLLSSITWIHSYTGVHVISYVISYSSVGFHLPTIMLFTDISLLT